MHWEQLLSLKRFGDTAIRQRKEQDETRLGFEVDYDRIIFSSAFRSLQDKTQVIPLSKTDFVHTRLTHSLEVSVVGRSLGRLVGQKLLEKYPNLAENGYRFSDFGAIVAAAALAHDIGNPPFGHSGEKAIGAYFEHGEGARYKDSLTAKEYQDLIKFEGNANGFRILNESKPGVPGGIRLSYATLGAFTKYPKESLPHKPTKNIADKKYGFFQNDKDFFKEVARELGMKPTGSVDDQAFARHPLAFLVEAADDICYTIIDFEDGINLGLIPEEFALEYLIKLVGSAISTKTYNQMQDTASRLSYLRALAINTLIREAVNLFMANEEQILKGEFHVGLLEKSSFKAQIEDIISLSVDKIYQSREVIEKEIAGFEILTTLLHARTKCIDDDSLHYNKLVKNLFGSAIIAEPSSVYDALIAICGEISMLTDSKALLFYKKIKGLDIE
ncbi:dGTP triphosphohydrolase [Flavimarina sp. Hel_I_48]|uniref:dGTP triphosphohydrolase n=1 Tax=Flavimarina sp. Hel_I_48 TaxID=1392488 RepID=UPI0004DEF0EC|nr:dNTP triphosphohydrolase [Flavimarina sp. Hel_I_48]